MFSFFFIFKHHKCTTKFEVIPPQIHLNLYTPPELAEAFLINYLMQFIYNYQFKKKTVVFFNLHYIIISFIANVLYINKI